VPCQNKLHPLLPKNKRHGIRQLHCAKNCVLVILASIMYITARVGTFYSDFEQLFSKVCTQSARVPHSVERVALIPLQHIETQWPHPNPVAKHLPLISTAISLSELTTPSRSYPRGPAQVLLVVWPAILGIQMPTDRAVSYESMARKTVAAYPM